MSYRIFTLPIRDPRAAELELNGFLGSHRVLTVERRWVDRGEDSLWVFCVDYLESAGAGPPSFKGGPSRGKIDYREVLNAEDFAVYVRLRDLRKQVSQAEAVPVYAVFTNEQLAQMVKTRATSKAALESIAGVGDARIEKYGSKFLDFLNNQ